MRSQVEKRFAGQLRTRALARARVGSLALLAGLIGCGAARPTQVVSVATHDLGCEQVSITEVASDRYAAYGCGRGAVYARVCDGDSCRWGRLRHGHEESIASGAQTAPQSPREILPAPAPQPRQVLPAPAPQENVAAPAPAPESSAVGSSAAPSAAAPSAAQGAPAAPTAGAQPLQDSALQANAAPAETTPVPLSQGYLSDPYQAQVPAQPIAQQVVYAPPAPLVETRPYPPARSSVWINGYWWWGPSNWVWVPGYWGAGYYGYSYLPGSWYWSTGYWRYSPGGWCRPGTSVIVHRGFPSRPSTSVTVRAFTPFRSVHAGYGGGVQRSVHAGGGYRPQASPLYPSSHRVVSPGQSGYGSSSHYRGPSNYGSGVGRVVAPNTAVRPPASYGNSYRSAPSRSYGGGGPVYRSTPSYGGGRSYDSGSRSYGGGGGGRSYGGGGGGRSYGSGGGGGRSMGSVRVSPGGGGRR